VDAVVLAACSAALFGAMTVAIRMAFARGADAELAAFLTVVPALAVALAVAMVRGGWELAGVWPFLLAGILGPGASQILIVIGVRDAGASRTSAIFGTAPLFAIVIAITLLDEPVVAGIVVGALLIVVGGIGLAWEPGRPEHLKAIGLLFALGAAVIFAVRDSFVRWVSLDTEVAPSLAAAATLVSAALVAVAWLLLRGRRVVVASLPRFLPAGLMFGLSYVCLFEAYYRGRVSVVSPIIATEALWAVVFSALLLRRTELVGVRLVIGAGLVVAGGVLISVYR